MEWKCDSLNTRSRKMALRLGFRYEGIFRNHMIIKGHSRDTAWFALADDDWGPGGVQRELLSSFPPAVQEVLAVLPLTGGLEP